MWYYVERGSGRPLILLHGIGMSHIAWNPVIGKLAEKRHILAFDIPGFGATPPLPGNRIPTMPHLAASLKETLRQIGITEPVDIVGNSLGGYIALEAAKQGIARSVLGISPAGLWKNSHTLYVNTVLNILLYSAKLLPAFLVHNLLKIPLLREILLTIPVSPGCSQMPSEDAIKLADTLASSTAFKETYRNTGYFTGGKELDIPITIAYGTRDYILLAGNRTFEELPSQTLIVEPNGWGHVPMWYDPEGVAQLILESTQ